MSQKTKQTNQTIAFQHNDFKPAGKPNWSHINEMFQTPMTLAGQTNQYVIISSCMPLQSFSHWHHIWHTLQYVEATLMTRAACVPPCWNVGKSSCNLCSCAEMLVSLQNRWNQRKSKVLSRVELRWTPKVNKWRTPSSNRFANCPSNRGQPKTSKNSNYWSYCTLQWTWGKGHLETNIWFWSGVFKYLPSMPCGGTCTSKARRSRSRPPPCLSVIRVHHE